MELDEFKNTWSALDKRLRKQEMLEETIIKEMLQSRSGKALSRLINYTYFGITVCLCAIALMVYRVTTVYFGIFKTSIFAIGIILLLIAACIGIYNVVLLQKIDFTKSVNENIRLTQTYKIRVKKQLAFSYALAAFLIILAVIACVISPNMELWRWIIISVFIVIGIIGACWEYKRIYRANTSTILDSLDKLKELEEDK